MLRYLTLTDIKKQCVIDESFNDDNAYLTILGETAEDYVEQLVNKSLEEIEAERGELPKCLYQAMLIFTDFEYAIERGSSGHDNQIPSAINTMIKLYRSFT